MLAGFLGEMAMRKSLVVELVLLNSVLALGCTRPCRVEDKKEGKDFKEKQPVTCRGSGSGYRGGGGHYFYWGGGGRTTSRPGTGTVGRGGFGSTGHAVS